MMEFSLLFQALPSIAAWNWARCHRGRKDEPRLCSITSSGGKLRTLDSSRRGFQLLSLPRISLLLLCGLLLGQGGVNAATDRYDEITRDQDFDVVEKPWKEERGEIPPLPGQGDWTEVRLDTLPKNQHAFLDLNSLGVGRQDQVVRYWIRIRSNGGGEMITYEGMHCGQRNYIVYAYAHPRRKPPVRKVSLPKWKPVEGRALNAYREELMRDVFCSGEVPRTLRQIRQAARGRYEQMNPFDNWTNDD